MKIRPYNVIDHNFLPAITLEQIPVPGDPLEIETEMYYACEIEDQGDDGLHRIGVIPLVVRNPAGVTDIETYITCLSTAHRRIQFRKQNNICDFNDCDEMIIS